MVHSGPASDRWAWSGIPHGLTEALRASVAVERQSWDLGPHKERIGAAVARKIPRYSVIGSDAAVLFKARTLHIEREDAVRSADVVVSLGTGWSIHPLTAGQRHLTLEDMTVAQAPFPPSRAKTRWIERQSRAYAQADVCCVATPWTADSLVRDYRVDSAKIAVVGFGANVVCKPTTKDWNSPTFLWVGVDWLRKGGDLLLEAFLRAKIPNATLHLVGAHPDISVRSVCGHGIVRDEARLRELFEMATVFVMPSRFEAAGIVFVEAASAGTPSIGTTVGGIPHMIGPAGECVPPEDVEAVAHARENTWTAVSQRMIDAVVSLDPDSSVGSSQAGPNP